MCGTVNIQAQDDIPVFKKISYPFLPVPSSEALLFSKDGLLWFSTTSGLVSFDGSGVTYHCTPAQGAELGLNTIYSFGEDSLHNFYIGTINGFLYFNRKQKTFERILYHAKGSSQADSIDVRTLYIDDDGLIYAGSSYSGFYVYNPATKNIIHYNLDSTKPDSWKSWRENTVSCLLPYRGNKSLLWVGTFQGIFLLDKVTAKLSRQFTIVNPRTDFAGRIELMIDIQRMEMATDSTILFNSYTGGLGTYNIKNGNVFILTRQIKPAALQQRLDYVMPGFSVLRKNCFLLGTKNYGPLVYNADSNSVHYFKLANDINPFDRIQFLINDPHGNIWMKSNDIWYESIPSYARMNSTRIHRKDPAGYSAELRGLYYDSSSHLYYGAVRMFYGVYVLDTNFRLQKIIPAPLFTNYYTNHQTCTDRITKDGSGRLWTTGWETYVLPPGKSKFDYVGNVLPSLAWIKTKGELHDVVSTRDGDILLQEVSTGNAYLINHTTLYTDTFKAPPFTNTSQNKIGFSYLSYDAKGNFCYITNTEQLIQCRIDKKDTRIIPEAVLYGNSKPGNIVTRYATDARGRIWVLKQNYGIRIIDPLTLQCVDSIAPGTRGLMNASYAGIMGGDDDYMFLEDHSAVYVYDYVKRQSFILDNTNGLSFPGPVTLLYANKQLVTATGNILQRFDMRTVSKNNFYPTPAINILKADTTTVFTLETGTSNIITLRHDQNNILLAFSAPDLIFPERLEYAYKLDGINTEWQYTAYLDNKVTYNHLSPGRYVFHLKAQMKGGNWDGPAVAYTIDIIPAWWQTNVFRVLLVMALLVAVILFTRWRIRSVRGQEQLKVVHEKELMEYEARALRAQMNPHFIFNCLNSIKALTQNNETKKATEYLTTFSKLIRTLFHNSDRRQISLYDEIETCRLYVQLETMRLNGKLDYNFDISPNLDLKSVMVPALIIQPFIENAIWHGIVPRGEGKLVIKVFGNGDTVTCVIDDDGIGREMSQLNKPVTPVIHESKGVHLSQARLHLSKLLSEMDATIETRDKYEGARATGTTVIISFKLN